MSSNMMLLWLERSILEGLNLAEDVSALACDGFFLFHSPLSPSSFMHYLAKSD